VRDESLRDKITAEFREKSAALEFLKRYE